MLYFPICYFFVVGHNLVPECSARGACDFVGSVGHFISMRSVLGSRASAVWASLRALSGSGWWSQGWGLQNSLWPLQWLFLAAVHYRTSSFAFWYLASLWLAGVNFGSSCWYANLTVRPCFCRCESPLRWPCRSASLFSHLWTSVHRCCTNLTARYPWCFCRSVSRYVGLLSSPSSLFLQLLR